MPEGGAEVTLNITKPSCLRPGHEIGQQIVIMPHTLKQDDDIYGLMSSHPAACLAATTAFGSKLPSFK